MKGNPNATELVGICENDVHVAVERLEGADHPAPVLQRTPHPVVDVLQQLLTTANLHTHTYPYVEKVRGLGGGFFGQGQRLVRGQPRGATGAGALRRRNFSKFFEKSMKKLLFKANF